MAHEFRLIHRKAIRLRRKKRFHVDGTQPAVAAKGRGDALPERAPAALEIAVQMGVDVDEPRRHGQSAQLHGLGGLGRGRAHAVQRRNAPVLHAHAPGMHGQPLRVDQPAVLQQQIQQDDHLFRILLL